MFTGESNTAALLAYILSVEPFTKIPVSVPAGTIYESYACDCSNYENDDCDCLNEEYQNDPNLDFLY